MKRAGVKTICGRRLQHAVLPHHGVGFAVRIRVLPRQWLTERMAPGLMLRVL
jgi:hypothetical protein